MVARGKTAHFLDSLGLYVKLKMPILAAPQKNTVYYLGEVEYLKKWLLDQELGDDDDDKKMRVLAMIKQVFDSQVYKGPRCDNSACVTKGKCPCNRQLNIVLVERASMTTEEKGWRSIMIHAYKTGDLEEAVFDKLIGPTGNPIKIELNAWGVVKGSGDQSVPQNMLKGYFAEVEAAEQITTMKDIMKKALEANCQADVMALQSEDYEEQKEQ